MEERIRLAVNEQLARLVDMGVLKQSQINKTLLEFSIKSLREGMGRQALVFADGRDLLRTTV